jgi:hypothetical protein
MDNKVKSLEQKVLLQVSNMRPTRRNEEDLPNTSLTFEQPKLITKVA